MSGQKWMNAKEMPILKNSKDNYQHTLSKTSFSACFNSAERLVNMYYWNKATGIRANVLITDCYSAREILLLTIVWDPDWGEWYVYPSGRISSYSGGLGRTGGLSHDFYRIKRFECSRHTQCNSIDCIFPMLIYWLYILLYLIAKRA